MRNQRLAVVSIRLDPPGGERRVQVNGKLDSAPVSQRRHKNLADAYGRDGLQPDRLPDAGRAVVINIVREAGGGLLAARLARVLPVFDAHGQTILSLIQVRRDVKLE